MSAVPKAIQAVILFSTLFGVLFLWEVHPVLPPAVFDFVAFGWVLFVTDCALTFVRPRASYYLGMVLAVLAFTATVSQPQHYALVENGNLLATVTIFVGSAAEILLIALVLYYLVSGPRGDPWSWPKS